MKILKVIACLSLWFCHVICFSQTEASSPVLFDSLYSRSMELNRLGLYAESVEVINEAIKVANENKLEEKAIMAQIDLAEIMRKSQDFEAGINMLQNIKNSEKYPLQHVRLLDRTIALRFEGMYYPKEQQSQAIQSLLDSAIILAERHGFREEEALLKNQKGYYMDKQLYASEAIAYITDAANIFRSLNDSLNYVSSLTNVLFIYGNDLGDAQKCDSIISILLNVLEGKDWYAGETQLYGFMSEIYLRFNGDSLAYHKWRSRKWESALNYKTQISNTEMDNFRVQQETLRFQQEADATALALKIEESRTQTLIILLSILVLAIISVIILFTRERKLKGEMRNINAQLKVANDKYQMLMVESNHRIKNNLQMVISMLEFASQDVDPGNKRALKRMSGKIHTVGLLHKLLYADVHNEFVNLQAFFQEIIELNTEMSLGDLKVKEHFDDVNVRSERIIYFGLILNEMLTNTIEHCKAQFKNVILNISKNGAEYQFHYQDNSAWEPDYKKGTGSMLIEQLIQRIGGREYTFDPNLGLFKFSFDAQD